MSSNACKSVPPPAAREERPSIDEKPLSFRSHVLIAHEKLSVINGSTADGAAHDRSPTMRPAQVSDATGAGDARLAPGGVPPRVAPERRGPPVALTPRGGPSPATFAQQRLWFIAELFPGSPTYNEPHVVHMDEDPDAAVLERCLSEVIRRHEPFRTVFTTADGELLQRILPPRPFRLSVIDLKSLPPEDREPEAIRLMVSDARRPFDLREGPLFRFLLLRLTDTDARLLVTAHHIANDGISFFTIFLPELHALYKAFSRGGPSPLPELLSRYADFAEWQRRWFTEEELSPKLSYWRAKLAGVTDLSLPTDHPRSTEPDARGAHVPLALSAELMWKLRELGHSAGVSLFTTLLAAWKTLLFRYTDQGDIVVGSAAAGRSRPEFDHLIGFFMNNLVLRTQLDGALTFRELLSRVSETLREAREHQDVPFDRLVTEVGREGSPSQSPLYNNVFILTPPLAELREPGFREGRLDIGTAKYDLYVELFQHRSGLSGYIEYKPALFSEATIERMASHFSTLLYAIVQDPEQRLSDLPLLSTAEKRQLAQFQGPAFAPRPDSEVLSLEQLFEAQAARSPEAIAVVHGQEQLSYAALNARANKLAHYLRAEGVGPDCLVGLSVERSSSAMVGILGVLKAGGAYVPLDPEYPRERLRFILDDAGIEILLTTRRSAGAMQHHGRTILLDEDWNAIDKHSAETPEPLADADNLAYVIYTSGSTGRPKGVLVERRGLYYLAKAQERIFGVGVGSRILSFFSLNFDGSVWDFTMAWPVGATVVLAEQAALLPGPNLTELLRKEEIHAVMVTPSALQVTPYEDLPALHTLITAGEVLSEELVARWAPSRRFVNVYGPTETTVVSVVAECHAGEGKPPIGHPFGHVEVYILDSAMRPVPIGIPGELYIGGPGVARGYLARPGPSKALFLKNPFSTTPGARLYKTGDRVKWLPDGSIDFLGRADHQIKLRGFRIELGEIEVELGRHPAVKMAAVKVLEISGDKRLVAYVVPQRQAPAELESALKEHLRERLPDYMVPSTFVLMGHMPLTLSGKIDRARLLPPPPPPQSAALPGTSLEREVAAIWREVLGVGEIDINAPFFEIGGHSLALARVQAKLSEHMGVDINMMTLLRLPTIKALTAHIATLPRRRNAPSKVEPAAGGEAEAPSQEHRGAIAIIGMAIRAPGVRGPEELWEVVREGRETIRSLDREALIASGADPERVRRPEFVPSEGVLDDADRFDAAFFGVTHADAALMDPQQRLFLECAHEALEHAGCDPARSLARVGVFGGTGAPLYWLGPVADALRKSGSELERYRARTLNAPDFLATRVAFKLGLRGPAVTVQTACSTSLTAVHLARQSLLAGECDVALAGGVSLTSLTEADQGYLRGEGGLESEDGRCRPFDAGATGMVPASGVAIVALKRLSDALRDGDTIHAVVLGSAMNNDGASKIGFTAPSEDGIADAIQRAYEVSGVDPGSVEFVEAHGTGTRLGDPTEVRALSRAYGRSSDRRGFCALGSLKANLGHTDSAASAASLIKASLALTHGVIPGVPGFRTPNPLLDLPSSPFFVNSASRPWLRTGSPRRAGVNAMGLGGTNVHVVLEEAPCVEASPSTRPFHLVCLSGRTPAALGEVGRRLGEHLAAHPSLDLADVAHTLAVGRAAHSHRAAMVVQDATEARAALSRGATPALSAANPTAKGVRPVVFLFPGHGAQYLKMGLSIYETEPVYRREVDRCLNILREDAGLDLRPLLLGEAEEGERLLDEMEWAQPLLFTIEYALARQLMEWGVQPAAMLGHSLGEYVAACIAGVLSLRGALALVVARGRLMDSTPTGSMLAVFADHSTIKPYLSAGVAVATYAPSAVVISGLSEDIEAARVCLRAVGIETSQVRCARAAHSPVMHTIRDAFRRRVSAMELQPPAIPIISNVTGRHMTAEQAMSPDYWADHLSSPVRLTDGLSAVLALESPICIEVGPGATLGSFLKRLPRYESAKADTLTTMLDFRKRDESAHAALLRGVGRAWELGVDIDWRAFYAHEKRRRVPLPTYPFERQRYMLESALEGKPASLDERARAVARELSVRGIDDYPGLRSRLTELSASLVLDFFARRLGHEAARPRSIEALGRSAGILPKFLPMLERLAQILLEAGLAEQTDAAELLLRIEQRAGRSAELAARVRQDYPAFKGLVRFIEHCTANYDEALTGAAEPVGVLYPDGTDAFYRACMRETAAYRYDDVYLTMAREAVRGIVERRERRRTRILEVGAGHGTLTWPLAERLRGADVDYHFTDISHSFLQRAEAKAARRELPWLKAFRFDLNQPPEQQGIHDRYDIILGLNAVHVALDLRATLENLRDILTPGGSLILVELTRVETWDEVTWGLAPGFWDVARARGALSMDLARWEVLLRRAGFAPVTCVPRDVKRRETEDHGLLIAERAPTSDRAERRFAARADESSSSRHPSRVAEDDRRASTPEDAERSAATDGEEQIVRSLWTRLLGVPRVPSDASFYDLGGDSLLAVQFLAELRVKTGRELKMRQFAAKPTVEGIAAHLRAHAELAPDTIPRPAPGPATPTLIVGVKSAKLSHPGESGRESLPTIAALPRAFAEPRRGANDSGSPSGDDAPPLSSVPSTSARSLAIYDQGHAARESSPAPEEEAVRAFLQKIIARMRERDGSAMGEELWAKDSAAELVAVSGGRLHGADAIKERYMRAYAALAEARVFLRDERVRVLAGGQIACVTAEIDSALVYADDGRRRSYQGVRVSFVLGKQSGEWRLLHAHYSLPIGSSDEAFG